MSKTSPAAEPNGKQKVRSAEVGTDILKALAQLSPATSLSRLAEHVQMPASKVHRYLQALIASGFAEQNPATNHYGLGREALRVGLAALGGMEVLKVAALPLSALHLWSVGIELFAVATVYSSSCRDVLHSSLAGRRVLPDNARLVIGVMSLTCVFHSLAAQLCKGDRDAQRRQGGAVQGRR